MRVCVSLSLALLSEGLKNITGKYLSYYDNGNIKIEGTYSSGKKTGRWIEYDESKNIVLEENWKDGKKHE